MFDKMVKMKNHKGFTLIEMLIVIAIIAILVSIVVPIIGANKIKAQAAVDAANVRTMAAEVATKMVSETDEAKLLEEVTTVDSQIQPGSHVLFYLINENEVRAYYCTSLLFTSQLRGVNFNSVVAETGKLDPPPYDTLPAAPQTYRLLGTLTSSGDSYSEGQIKEVASLAGSFVDDFLGVSFDGNLTTSELRNLWNLVTGNDIGARTKIALIETLMEKYGYTAEQAEKEVSSGKVTSQLKENIDVGDGSLANKIDDELDKALTEAGKSAEEYPEYKTSTYFGCTKNWRGKWTHGEDSTKTMATYEQYCKAYGLKEKNDCNHN